jgi:hypothetical protein
MMMEEQTISNNQFVWRKEWLSPYESLWSVFEKFKYVNCASAKDIFKLFGTDYVRSLKSPIKGRIHRNCIDVLGIDKRRIESVFLQPLIEINKQNLNNLVGRLPLGIHHYNYIRYELHFCPVCIKMGFHSIFHQFKLLKKCPYHNIPLQKECPNCHTSFPFEITDSYTKSPFQCKCGKYLLDQTLTSSLVPNWGNVSLEQLKSSELKTWLNLNQEEVERLRSFYIPLLLDLDNCPEYLCRILTVVKHGNLVNTNHNTVKSAPYIRHLISKNEKEDTKLNTLIQRYNLYDEIYNSSLKTVKSIVSHVRNTFLINHKNCITKLRLSGEEDPVCPFATAYDHWTRFTYGYEDDFFIRRPKPYRKYPTHLEFGSKQDNYYLIQLYEELSYHHKEIDIRKENRATIKWIFNRVLSHLIINNFNYWLSISEKLAKNNPKYKSVPYNSISSFDFPFYVLVIPANKNESLEFHWWQDINQIQMEKIESLECPFQ